MAQSITEFRVVLASPSDVKREREAFSQVIDQVNRDTARPAGFHLNLWRWETDARPGFNPLGPQGLIDRILKIDQCDLFVGIFWNRIGSPTRSGLTGTEHEFGTAFKSWKRQGSPDIMFYFNEKPSNLTSDADLIQRRRVLEFRKAFPEEGLFWPYKGHAEFVKYANEHLRRFVRDQIEIQNRPPGAREQPAGSVSAPEREKGFILNVGRGGAVRLSVALRRMLKVDEGDRLDVRVVDNRIVSGMCLPHGQRFDPAKVTRQMRRRLGSPEVSVAASDLQKGKAKGKRHGR